MKEWHTSSTKVAVSSEAEWLPMSICPRSTKVQLLNLGLVGTYGQWDGSPNQWKGWAPLPHIPQWLKDEELEHAMSRVIKESNV